MKNTKCFNYKFFNQQFYNYEKLSVPKIRMILPKLNLSLPDDLVLVSCDEKVVA